MTRRFTEIREITPLDEQVAERFADNTVINSRYTVFNFLFKNIYEQFRRPINLYFLLVALLQFYPIIAPVNPLSTLLPLLFAFLLTAVKEGYDDLKRHRQDSACNARLRLVLDAKLMQWRYKRNADIRVGDVILLQQDELIPCDVVVIAASGPNVYIRTDNLDGEIDLKPRDVVNPPSASHSRPSLTLAEDGTPSLTQSVQSEAGGINDIPGKGTTERSDASFSIGEAPDLFFSLKDDVPLLMHKLSCLRLRCPAPNSIIESFDGIANFNLNELSTLSATVELNSTETHATSRQVDTTVTAASEERKTATCSSSTMHQISLSYSHLLPQSCLLKNTARVIAIAVYTGCDTKCGMNQRPAAVKWAHIDQDVNRYSIFIFVCQWIGAIFFGVLGYILNRHIGKRYWYLPQPPAEETMAFFLYPLRYFLLTSVMIPISVKFVMDMGRYYMAQIIEWDEAMMHPGDANADDGVSYQGCKVKNSDILEDLGQVDYVLCDKTGTLTQNVMHLRYLSVAPNQQIALDRLELSDNVCTSPTSGGIQEAMPSDLESHTKAAGLHQRPTVPYQTPEALYLAQMLALCNTVEVVTSASKSFAKHAKRNLLSCTDGPFSPLIFYQAASPDEVALCYGVTKLGVILESRMQHRALVRVCGVAHEYFIHHIFSFSSENKSMGVIVEHTETRRISLVIKGADDRVAPMLLRSFSDAYPSLSLHLAEYARNGFRTLLVAQRELARDELEGFLLRHREATLRTEERQSHLNRLRAQMEQSLELIGITAIEDMLQNHVRETISDLAAAGITTWMLTGDKVETAEQIGLACGLYAPGDRVIRIVDNPALGEDWMSRPVSLESLFSASSMPQPLTTGSSDAQHHGIPTANPKRSLEYQTAFLEDNLNGGASMVTVAEDTNRPFSLLGNDVSGFPLSARSPPGPPSRTVLIVQGGHVLDHILACKSLSAQFHELSARCVSIIYARTTPRQKAAVTQFVRQRGHLTLCIGDGGNDVAMLQEAHVGVGIMGKEGQQAARAADFAITQFSDLRSLMFVHGQQAYVRSAFMIKYSFYKSVLIAIIQIFYNIIGNHYSGGTFWSGFFLTMWNGLYTLPQTLFYCLDRCAPRVVLERNPPLYKLTREGVDMRASEFFGFNVLRGIMQSIAVLWLATRILGVGFAYPDSGGTASYDVTYTVSYTALILSQMLTVYTESHSVTFCNLFWLLGMPLFYFVSVLAFSSLPFLEYFGVFRRSLVLESWLAAIAIAVAVVIPFLALGMLRDVLEPNCRKVLRTVEIQHQRWNLSFNNATTYWRRLYVFLLGWETETSSMYIENEKMACLFGAANTNSAAVIDIVVHDMGGESGSRRTDYV